MYPPNRSDGKDEWWWENTSGSDEMDYDYDGHDDEHDHEGSYYDDNFYDPTDTSLYPSYAQSTPSQAPAPGMADGPAFPMPLPAPLEQTDIATKLDLLVSLEVTPLFAYLSTPSFALSSITVPLYFMNQTSFHARFAARPDYALPLKIRYWAHVAAHALAMLRRPAAATTLAEVRVKYMPWDIWASMNPADDLHAMVETGVWGDETEDEDGDGDADEQRGAKGMAFRAVWMALLDMGVESPGEGLSAHVRFVKWEGDLDKWRVGDELEVVFTRKEAQPEGS
ncbi:hypothetical protein BDV95DRAFT_577204 [Massariosphaeria phaeospora]|uniref:Uncharacterized protein n=1 Tax=Massariosphaeria phaeospora TaxID=100035 RepID=A0A7C8M6U9_9PLEO|nr:hypothetical protein BDV95DRAFT_577204 [Massariosphaeria phaeospora]